MNCASDYYAYCSMHTAGSPGCHACMRANRPRLSNSCVSALIDDGVMPREDVAQQKAKIAVAKAKPAPPLNVMPAANPVAKESSARPETLARDPTPQTPPLQQPVQSALAIDQQTFEAFKNRAPYFLATAEVEAKFEVTSANVSPQPLLASR